MADRIFHSSPVTFVDRTDDRKLDVYISSNHPTIQLYNTNVDESLAYTPDWSVMNLKLEANFYVDSTPIAPTDIEWSSIIGTTTTALGKQTSLTVSTNALKDNPIITYRCDITYQNLKAFKEITFTRVDTGLNGSDGSSAPAVQAQYSVDGKTSWTSTLNVATHKYIRYSYDGGKTWTTAIKMVGEDGTSVNIKGTATSRAPVSSTSYYTLVYNSATITGAALGDAYLLDGNMYVCVDSRDDNDYFMDVGRIQGPQGNDGQSSYVFIRYATDASGANMTASPTSTTTHIGICTVNTNVAPTTASSYTWSKFVGDSAKSIILSGTSQIFKVSPDATPIYTPTTIKVTAQVINTTVATWEYSVNGGIDWATTAPAGVSLNASTNTLTITGKDLTSNTLVIRASNGVYKDVYTIHKVFDGVNGKPGNPGDPASMAFLTNENVSFSANANGVITASPITTNVVAYRGATKQMPTIGTNITGAPEGMIITTRQDTLLNEVELTISFVTGTNLGSNASTSGTITIPVTAPVVTNLKLSWSKINSGAKGDKGDKGGDAYTVMLTNESYIFAGDVNHAYESNIETQIIGYKGSAQQPVTIKSVNSKTAAIIDTDTGIPGLKFKCSALSNDTSPTITFTCTEDFEEPSGAIPIVVSIDNVDFTRMFNYSIAFKGATGGTGAQGPQGTAATSYWLISSASAVQKTSTGTIAVTPSTLTFTGKAKTGTSVPIDYACRWIIAYSTDGTNYTNLYTSTANETSKSITVATTYKTIRARMYMAGGTTALLDEQIIPVVSDGAKGDIGVGINSVTVDYGVSTSASTQPTTWYPTIQTAAEGSYLWTRTMTDYTDSSMADTVTYTYAKQGKTPVKGTDYVDGTSVTVSSIQYQASTSATTAPTGTWSDGVVPVAEGSYLWTKTTFSDKKVAYGVAKQGKSGSDAYTVILTNESHIFAGTVSSATASSATTQVMAYKGGSSQSVTIVSVNGKTASTSSTATGISGLSFACSALSGNSPTITFTCTTSFVSPSGAIPIVLTVDGVTVTKIFTYGIAFKGTIGTPASLVDITPSAYYFKSTMGKDGAFTPDYIYLYPRFQTVTFSKWEYSVDGGTTWVAASGANGLTISTYNSTANTLRIAKTSTLYTDTVTSISFRCVSSNASVYDTVSIAKIYDVVDLNIGGRNLLLNTGFDGGVSKIYNLPSSATSGEGGLTFNLSESLSASTEVALRFQIRGLANVNVYWMMTGGNVAQTVISKSKISPTEFSPIELRYTVPTGKILNSVFICTAYGNSTAGTDWFEIKAKSLKLELGNTFTDYSPAPEDLKSTTFQLHAPKGYLITNDVPEVTLETFAYDGSQPITGATFSWHRWNGETWVVISGATDTSLTLNKSNVLKSSVYKCEMTYGDKVYEATATVEDKTDVYDSLIHITSKYSSTNRLYWVLYSTVYSEEGERDELLGPIGATAPSSPTTGSYWYKVDETNYTVTLMKYSGTAWATTTDKQELVYDWFLLNDVDKMITLGAQSKVKIVTANDFSRTCSVQCNVSDAELILLTHNNQILTDPSDPIISATAPTNPINGQLWIKTNANGSYVLSVWDSSVGQWVVSEADTQNKVYVTKPTQYNTGDLWIVDSNYQPVAYDNGVVQTYKHPEKTMLRAIAASQTYSDAHWVEALKYQKELDGVIKDVDKFKQFMSIDDTGLIMQAKGANGTVSDFKTVLTNTELGFYQGASRVAYINNNQLNISKAEITNGMNISGTTPELQIGNFVLIQESNGSLSIGLKS